MWNDLMRRWMELAFWWVPGSREETDHPGSESQTPTPRPQATPKAPTAPEPAPTDAAESASQPEAAASATPRVGPALTQIKGIGPAMVQRLGDVGIHSAAELAGADAATLTEQLKAGGAVVSQERVAGWIAAAAKL